MKKLLLSFILITILHQAKAQWSGNSAVNNAIVTTSNTTSKTGLVSINDGSNNMIITWVDNRNSATTGSDIYVQKINNDGTLPWGAEKLVCNAANAQANVSITSDGAGGAIIAWGDKRAGLGGTADEQVYGQRIKSDGTIGWATNGLALAKGTVDPLYYRRGPGVKLVNTTEFVVVFTQNSASNEGELLAQKCLVADGLPQWATDTEIHGAQLRTQTNEVMLADGAGGIFVVWEDPRISGSEANIFGQKINNLGALQWGAAGALICDAATNQTTPQIVSDGSGGLVTTWTDFRNGSNDIYAQRVNTSGVRQWDVGVSPAVNFNGVPICVINGLTPATLNNQSAPKIINDGSNNFILAWNDNRNTGNSTEIYAQKLNAAGAAIWTLNGVPVVAKASAQGSGGDFTIEDALGGSVFITFRDAIPATTVAPIIPAHNDIYVQRINSSNGAVTTPFVAAGVPVCTEAASQTTINTIIDGAGGLIISWQDSRNSSNGAIYASRLFSNGTLPVKYTSITANLNTNETVLVKWNIASEINTQKYIIEKAGENGIFSSIGTISANNLASYQFIDAKPISGNNYYRIKAVDFDGTISLSEIAIIAIKGLKESILLVYPNPVEDILNINLGTSFSQKDIYQLKIYDLKGALKISKLVTTKNNTLTLKINDLETGIYTLEVSDLTGDNRSVNKIIKL